MRNLGMHRSIGVGLALVVGLGAQACGSGTDLNGGSDDGRRRPTTVVDDEEQVFELVEMTPEVESHIATPLSVVTLTYNLDVDPNSVDGVVLRERGSERTIPVEVEVEGKKITITPQRPLGEKAFYTVVADAVKSLEPNTSSVDFEGRFFTRINFVDLYLRYQSSVATRAHDFEWNAETRELLISHWAPGTDGVVMTPDDVQDLRAVTRFDENFDETWSDTRGEAGEDGVYGTQDDVRLYLREISYSPLGEVTRTNTFYGADLLAGTVDDYKQLSTSTYGEGDRVDRVCGETTCTAYRYGEAERFDVELVDPGPDGVWQTEDDLLGTEYAWVRFDARGLATGIERHLVGVAGDLTPSSETLVSYTAISRDQFGLPIESTVYDGAGPDGLWMTEDDHGQSRTIYTHDEDGFQRTRHLYGPGADDLIGSPDDEIRSSFYFQANNL